MRTEQMRKRVSGWRLLIVLVAALGLMAAACGDDDDTEAGDGSDPAEETTDELVNGCPEDGCTITITDVVAEGDELRVTWDTNFGPKVAQNHIHVYWDTYEPDEVSGDAVARGVEQGDWVPTEAAPEFLTEGAASIAARGDSTTLCVTAADREHAVLDAAIEHCFDVSDVLPA